MFIAHNLLYDRERCMYATQWKATSRRRLARDVSDLLHDVEDYLAASAAQTGEAATVGRDRLLASISTAKLHLADFERKAASRTRAAGRTANDFVHENVWPGIVVAACLGFVAGWLSRRR
jgi:ElaB/YqjD/DUF883 family membrane-anchored ribosome-binding protein